jgi:hypothetical protein
MGNTLSLSQTLKAKRINSDKRNSSAKAFDKPLQGFHFLIANLNYQKFHLWLPDNALYYGTMDFCTMGLALSRADLREERLSNISFI